MGGLELTTALYSGRKLYALCEICDSRLPWGLDNAGSDFWLVVN